ncbi:hypothetical protein P8C59_000972 [Phyllachora maydis]|uniref:Uncharacterized protein n=1 Tax=Phyllachora maydis TaxID=1825666 RepID=A0AAD9HXG0_9PEZI|nr:hypothetical protein P8C59_000972 [Phyllachora maydis]
MYLLRRSCPDLGQSSRPPPPIRTLLEDKEDSEDYSEVIEALKQHMKSYKRVIASQSSDIKTLLLSLNTLKASIKDSVSAIKNISSTLASLTNSSNATTTRKTSYSPRFNPFSSTIDLDSPLCPPRKEPYLGPAINSATSNLDPPIDIGSKEGFKDTITSSIVKELSKKAYTIPDDKSKKEDIYNEFHALTFSTYKKGLLALNAEFNGYLTKLTTAKIDIGPSLILNQNPAIEVYRVAYIANSSNSTSNSNSNPSKKGKNKKKGKKKASYNIKGQNYSAKSAEQASFMLGSCNLAIEEEEEESNLSPNSNFKKSGFFLNVKGSSKPILHANFAFPLGLSSYTTKSIELQYNKIVVEIPSNSIRKEDYIPIIEDAIVSKAIEPKKAIGARREAIIPLEKRFKSLKFTSKTEEYKLLAVLGSKTYLVYIPSRRAVFKTSTVKSIKDNTVLSQPINNTALKGELVDLDLDLEGAVSLDPSNLNTKKPISIEIGPRKLEPYESSSNSKLDKPLPDKPINPLSRSLNRPTKLHLNAAKNLFKYLNSTKDYSICFSYNGNTVANLGPKLSNSSNTTTKLSRDFHSKEGPRPLTTTSTTIVDSRNGKGSSRTSIINSSLVPIGFSDSDFTWDKATSKSTYSYLYKLAGRPISWKMKRATTFAFSTLEAETNGLIEAIREV